jgi:TolB-like protein/class 3 adenylate cyclase
MSVTGSTADFAGTATSGRKLIVVAYADMVGYSRLIGMDDAGTLARLRELRSTLIDPAIDEHGGRIVQTGGDSLLIVFDSIDGAVRCVVKVQQQVPIYDRDHAPDRVIRFRIGVNLGDAIADGTDLHGDAVNVAARLQSECPPGAVCVSRSVHDHVHGRLDLVFEKLGTLNLKNITRPVEAFVLRPDDAAIVPKSVKRPLAHDAGEALPLPDKPSLVVLPFQNMSGNPEQEYFVDGLVEDITTALSCIRSLFVIARNSAFTYKGRAVDVRQVGRELGVRYVLEGSMRRSGNRVRITGQLIDAASGAQIWANRFDGEMADIFELQDQVTDSVVAAIEPKLRAAEIERARRKPTANLQAYDLFLRASPSLHSVDRAVIEQAIALLERAITLDPDYARALALQVRLQMRNCFVGGADPSDPSFTGCVRRALVAVEKARDDPEVLWMAGFAISYGGDLRGGITLLDRSLALNPSSSEALANSALIRAFIGDRATVIAHGERAMRLSPTGPDIYHVYQARCILDLVDADYEGCCDWAAQVMREMPDYPSALRYRAASLGLLGRHEEAQEVIRRLRAVCPEDTIARVRMYFAFLARLPETSGAFNALLEGLRRAGLPG